MSWQKETDPFYLTDTWRALRKQVLQRDHYRCKRCRKRWASIVHHIIPRKERPDLALAAENLESVCERCHNQLHPEKGAKTGRRTTAAGVPEGVRVIVIK